MTDDPRLLQWRNLPMELRLKKQWLVANPAKKNPLFHRDNQFYNASVSRHTSTQWMSFEEATTIALTHNLAIGFVICEGEDITCIDLDVKPDTRKETLDLFQSIVKNFDTYTERSVSGHGIHIWCKGSIGLGRRRDGVEIYSQNRFMICTGNVLHNKEQLEARQNLLTNMVSQMPLSADYSEIVLEELPAIETDEDIGRKLWEIEDARMLWQGMWRELDHPSQSEGDLDLMVHLVRFSPSNEQCRRLFRQSGLGKRTKANRTDYITRTLSHARLIRQTEAAEAELGKRSMEAIAAKYDAEQAKAAVNGTGHVEFFSAESFIQTFDPGPQPEPEEDNSRDPFPPGGLGYLARYLYNSSIHPNVDFSVAASITIVSALCGRGWNTNTRSGLNTYNLVVAPSGMGKDEMQKGISRLIELCSVKFPTFKEFFHFGHFASGQGLMKHFTSSRPCFAHVMGEFGALMKKFSTGRDENMQHLMTVMLGIHSKSGPNQTSDSIVYSDATKNVPSFRSPSYSILGDTTPEVFESISAFLLNNGLMSRFNTFEYKGARNKRNEKPDYNVDPGFIEFLVLLAQTSGYLSQKNEHIVATFTPEAQSRYDKFEKYCDDNYNLSILNKGSDIEHHMWARSTLKINVLATLSAILDTPLTKQGNSVAPCINEAQWDYFERYVMNDINNFKGKQEAGDLGTGDSVQLKKLEKVIDDYLVKQLPASYGVKPELQANSKIQYSYMRTRMANVPSFRTEGNFDEKKFKNTIQTLIQIGKLILIKDPAAKGTITGDLYWVKST